MTITKTYSILLSKGALLQDGVLILSEKEFNELRDALNSAAIPAQGKPLSPPSYPHQIRIPCSDGGYAVLTTSDTFAEIKKAQAEGKTIQCRQMPSGNWVDMKIGRAHV